MVFSLRRVYVPGRLALWQGFGGGRRRGRPDAARGSNVQPVQRDDQVRLDRFDSFESFCGTGIGGLVLEVLAHADRREENQLNLRLGDPGDERDETGVDQPRGESAEERRGADRTAGRLHRASRLNSEAGHGPDTLVSRSDMARLNRWYGLPAGDGQWCADGPPGPPLVYPKWGCWLTRHSPSGHGLRTVRLSGWQSVPRCACSAVR